MKRKFLLTFTLVLVVTIVSIFYTTASLRWHRYNTNENDHDERTANERKEQPKNKEIPIIVVNNCSTQTQTQNQNQNAEKIVTIEDQPIDYLKKYPQFLDCKNKYNEWKKGVKIEPSDQEFNFSVPADKQFHDKRFTRAVLIYFPITQTDYYRDELKWLYRSWIHMIKYEPPKWRTDLIVFVENDATKFNGSGEFFMEQMNCRFENKRKSAEDKPMCTLINYVSLKQRNFNTPNRGFANEDEKYRYLLKDVNIFKTDNVNEFDTFYKLMKQSLSNYGYLDSILMAFEGYEYFKSAGYDFLVRSDMDVFLTPLFGSWLPRHCNDFNVGRGGYSTMFNAKRFGRIASNLGLKYAGQQNMGSTWYSTPDQFRLVSYLTLFGMAYLAAEEFSQVEREGKLGVQLWPDWHYGVLLLYGQTLALNHLIASEQAHVVKLENHLDFPSGNTNSVHSVLNIHVFHGDDMFSKFVFKVGKYDQMNATDSDEVKFYCLKMALDGKRMAGTELYNMLVEQSKNKS